jgi:hypothetical protein
MQQSCAAVRASLPSSKELRAGINLFADKAYSDKQFKTQLESRRIKLLTPLKKPKKRRTSGSAKAF